MGEVKYNMHMNVHGGNCSVLYAIGMFTCVCS